MFCRILMFLYHVLYTRHYNIYHIRILIVFCGLLGPALLWAHALDRLLGRFPDQEIGREAH